MSTKRNRPRVEAWTTDPEIKEHIDSRPEGRGAYLESLVRRDMDGGGPLDVMVEGWAYKTLYGICQYVGMLYEREGIRYKCRHLMESGEDKVYSVARSEIYGRATADELRQYLDQWDPFLSDSQRPIHSEITEWYIAARKAERPLAEAIIYTDDEWRPWLVLKDRRHPLHFGQPSGTVELRKHPLGELVVGSTCHSDNGEYCIDKGAR